MYRDTYRIVTQVSRYVSYRDSSIVIRIGVVISGIAPPHLREVAVLCETWRRRLDHRPPVHSPHDFLRLKNQTRFRGLRGRLISLQRVRAHRAGRTERA